MLRDPTCDATAIKVDLRLSILKVIWEWKMLRSNVYWRRIDKDDN